MMYIYAILLTIVQLAFVFAIVSTIGSWRSGAVAIWWWSGILCSLSPAAVAHENKRQLIFHTCVPMMPQNLNTPTCYAYITYVFVRVHNQMRVTHCVIGVFHRYCARV